MLVRAGRVPRSVRFPRTTPEGTPVVAIPAAKPGVPSPTAPGASNTGGATAKGPNPGNQDAALQKFVVAAEAMKQAIGAVPQGTPVYGKALKISIDLNKLLEELQAEKKPGSMIQTLMGMARGAHSSAPMQALARMAPQPGGGAPQAGGAG